MKDTLIVRKTIARPSKARLRQRSARHALPLSAKAPIGFHFFTNDAIHAWASPWRVLQLQRFGNALVYPSGKTLSQISPRPVVTYNHAWQVDVGVLEKVAELQKVATII